VQFFALSYIHDIDAAKSIANDVFVTLWENREQIDFERQIINYLLIVTRNKCINYLRKRNVERCYVESEGKYNIERINSATLLDESSVRLFESEVERLLTEAIEEMPDKIRKAFIYNRFENMTYQEIARKEGVSIKAIEYRLMVSLRILRVKLKDYLPVLGYIILFLCLK
jgi:RNA polymerase sigma-70 factor (ECF subfamily)